MSYRRIIENIKNTPVIWQSTHPYYGKPKASSRAWRKIAKKTKVDEKILKKCWNYFRIRYGRELKKVLASTEPKSDEMQSTWKYYNDLSFLKNAILRENESKVNTGHKTNNETPPSINKIEHYGSKLLKNSMSVGDSYIALDHNWQNDHDYMFMMSILPSMKNLSSIQKLQFRVKVSEWVLEIEMQNGYASAEYNEPDEDSKIYVHIWE